MIYTVEKASLVAKRLNRFADSSAYLVVRQYANVDFWIGEVLSAINALDGHRIRFEKMSEAQKSWVEKHGSTVPDYCPLCGGICELSKSGRRKPELPKQRAKNEIVEVRRELVDSTYFFLIRSYHLGLLSEVELKNVCEKIGTSIDPEDIE